MLSQSTQSKSCQERIQKIWFILKRNHRGILSLCRFREIGWTRYKQYLKTQRILLLFFFLTYLRYLHGSVGAQTFQPQPILYFEILEQHSGLMLSRAPRIKEPWGFLNVFWEMCKLTFRDVSSVGLSSPICKMNKMPMPHEGSGSLIIIWNSLHLSRSKAMQDLIKSELWVSISGLSYP